MDPPVAGTVTVAGSDGLPPAPDAGTVTVCGCGGLPAPRGVTVTVDPGTVTVDSAV